MVMTDSTFRKPDVEFFYVETGKYKRKLSINRQNILIGI